MLLVLQLTPFVGSTNTDGEADCGRSCSKGFRLCGPPCSVLVLSTKPRMNGISLEEQYPLLGIFVVDVVYFQAHCILLLS